MPRSATISISLILLAAFALFNAGMPVYFYLCPMMSSDTPMCDMSPAPSDGLSLTSVTPDCCARIFVADRQTTPFLKSSGPDLDRSIVTPAIDGILPSLSVSQHVPQNATYVASSPPPLYLLNSALLI